MRLGFVEEGSLRAGCVRRACAPDSFAGAAVSAGVIKGALMP